LNAAMFPICPLPGFQEQPVCPLWKLRLSNISFRASKRAQGE
jgi:hypothetical protein